jgi:hypothetical protein
MVKLGQSLTSIPSFVIFPTPNCFSKKEAYKLKFFWLNIRMTCSKCTINLFFSLFFTKVNVERHCSFSIEPITYTTTSLTNLLYSRIFFHKICDEEEFFHNLVHGFTSKDFWIANLEFFFMVLKNKDLCR